MLGLLPLDSVYFEGPQEEGFMGILVNKQINLSDLTLSFNSLFIYKYWHHTIKSHQRLDTSKKDTVISSPTVPTLRISL